MKLLFSIFVLAITINSYSQVTSFGPIFWQNLTHVNPAMSGLEFKHHATSSYRANYSDGSRIGFVDYNTRIYNYHGIGANYTHTSDLPAETNNANVNYNYQWMLKNGNQLSTGISVGIQHVSFYPFYEESEELYDSLHPHLITPNLNIGFAYRARNWFVGLSVASLLTSVEIGDDAFNFLPSRNVNAHASYNLIITRKSFIRTQLLVQSDFKTSSMNLSASFIYNGKLTLGLGYRTRNVIYVTAGWKVRRTFFLGYGIEYAPSDKSPEKRLNHQLTVGLTIDNKRL